MELFGGRVIRAMQRHVSSLAKAGMEGGHRENVLKAAQVMGDGRCKEDVSGIEGRPQGEGAQCSASDWGPSELG